MHALATCLQENHFLEFQLTSALICTTPLCAFPEILGAPVVLDVGFQRKGASDSTMEVVVGTALYLGSLPPRLVAVGVDFHGLLKWALVAKAAAVVVVAAQRFQ